MRSTRATNKLCRYSLHFTEFLVHHRHYSYCSYKLELRSGRKLSHIRCNIIITLKELKVKKTPESQSQIHEHNLRRPTCKKYFTEGFPWCGILLGEPKGSPPPDGGAGCQGQRVLSLYQ